MTRRRSRRGRRQDRATLVMLATATGGAMLILAGRTLPVLLLVAVAAGAGYAAGRLRRSRSTGSRRPPDSVAGRTVPRPNVPRGDNRARRNGWLPPARPATVTLALSRECAGDEHGICPGGSCECLCGHDARVIVAMYAAREAAPDEPPF